MDSHADTCAVGDNFVMLNKADHFISVHPFDEEYKPLWNIPIGTVAAVWTHSDNESYVLVFHKVLFFGICLQHSLICPNQLHANCLTVHHGPHQFDSNGTHSIYVHDANLHIPLSLSGVLSVFQMLTPASAIFVTLPCIVMTSSPPWNPNLPSFATMEETYKVSSMNSHQGYVNFIADMNLPCMIAAVNMFNTQIES